MELRRYWSTIWHYRWLVLALPLIVGLVSSALWLIQPNGYTTTVKVQIALAPPQVNADGNYFRYDNYYNYLATEYAVDDLVEVLNGNVFADAVAATLRSPEYGLTLTDEMVRSAFTAQRIHRVLIAKVTTGDKDRTVAIARAINATIARDPVNISPRATWCRSRARRSCWSKPRSKRRATGCAGR